MQPTRRSRWSPSSHLASDSAPRRSFENTWSCLLSEPSLDHSYLLVLCFDISNNFSPVGGLVRYLSESTFVGPLTIVHINNLVLYFKELFVKVSQSLPVLLNFFLPHLLIDGPCNFFDQTETEEKIKDIEAFLEDAFVLSFVVPLFAFLGRNGLLANLHKNITDQRFYLISQPATG